jgi:DNA polymerase V
MLNQTKLHFYLPDTENSLPISFVNDVIKAGFPSPAGDFDESKISIDQIVVKNQAATFYAKASGNSMVNAGIDDGDILVIDRSLEPSDYKIAVCCIDGDFTVKRIKIDETGVYLQPENDSFKPIKVTEENELIIWGIVTYVIKKL